MAIRSTWTLDISPAYLYQTVVEHLKEEEVHRQIQIDRTTPRYALIQFTFLVEDHDDFWDRFDQKFEGLLDEGPLLQK